MEGSPILQGAIFPTLVRYAIPSILGLLAITTASIVDGIFVGRFVSSDALAAVNLMIPYLTLVFGLALMIAIGGAVRAGRSLGAGHHDQASGVFSRCMFSVVAMALLFLIPGLLFDGSVLTLLGAPEHLHETMRPYFRWLSVVLVLQLTSMVLYYFVRMDGQPGLATLALSVGAVANILLDALFIIHFELGLVGAAWATGLAQLLQLAVLTRYFRRPGRKLRFMLRPGQWRDMFKVAYNGVSEFINECSGGVVILVLNWLLVSRLGVDGIAAFTVVNYTIFLSLMIYYGIADAVHLLVSQNLGAGQAGRIRGFMSSAFLMVACVAVVLVSVLLAGGDWLIGLFLQGADSSVLEQSHDFIAAVWPLFLVNGLNVCLSIYLTAMHQPLPSLVVALSRSLVLPVGLLFAIATLFPQVSILVALPIAEWVTFALALGCYRAFSPERAMLRCQAMG